MLCLIQILYFAQILSFKKYLNLFFLFLNQLFLIFLFAFCRLSWGLFLILLFLSFIRVLYSTFYIFILFLLPKFLIVQPYLSTILSFFEELIFFFYTCLLLFNLLFSFTFFFNNYLLYLLCFFFFWFFFIIFTFYLLRSFLAPYFLPYLLSPKALPIDIFWRLQIIIKYFIFFLKKLCWPPHQDLSHLLYFPF